MEIFFNCKDIEKQNPDISRSTSSLKGNIKIIKKKFIQILQTN